MRQGFTLIELLVVIGIIATLLAVILTSRGTVERAKEVGEIKCYQNGVLITK